MSRINLLLRNNKPRDFTKYILMYRAGAERKVIVDSLVEDLGIAQKTAEQTYYTRVRATALKQIESEKVADIDTIVPGKFFTERERLRIQKAARIR